MMNYDPGNFESVMVCLRDRYGADAFKNPGRLYSSICDLSPKLKPYGNVMRQLAERGAPSPSQDKPKPEAPDTPSATPGRSR